MALLRSFGYAFQGIGHLLRTQRSFRIEIAIGALALGASLWLGLERWEWVVLALAIALVLIVEALNTALENAVTLASPERDPRAKAAKDVAAAAVLVAAVAAISVGVLFFGPRVSALLGR